jgi:hypothetical protein
MEKKKVVFVLLALAGFFVFAAGGTAAFLGPDGGAVGTFVVPLLHGNLIDTGIALASLVLLVWALMPTGPGEGIGRTQLLQGIALGSALVVCGCVALCLRFEGATDPRLPGALALVAAIQAAVGLLAGMLLLLRRESRASGITPVLANGGLTALVVVLTHGHLFA